MKRHQSRRANGRFVRNTLENTVGLRAIICPHCKRLNPYGRKEVERDTSGFIDPRALHQWDVPTHCHACAGPLPPDAEHF